MNFNQIKKFLARMVPPKPAQKKQLIGAMMASPKPTLKQNIKTRNTLLKQAQRGR